MLWQARFSGAPICRLGSLPAPAFELSPEKVEIIWFSTSFQCVHHLWLLSFRAELPVQVVHRGYPLALNTRTWNASDSARLAVASCELIIREN